MREFWALIRHALDPAPLLQLGNRTCYSTAFARFLPVPSPSSSLEFWLCDSVSSPLQSGKLLFVSTKRKRRECRDREDAAKPAVLQDAYTQQGNQLIIISCKHILLIACRCALPCTMESLQPSDRSLPVAAVALLLSIGARTCRTGTIVVTILQKPLNTPSITPKTHAPLLA